MFSPWPKFDKKEPNTSFLSVDRAQDNNLAHLFEDWIQSEKLSEIKTPLPKFDQMTQTLLLLRTAVHCCIEMSMENFPLLH